MIKRALNLACALLWLPVGAALAQDAPAEEEEESWLDKASFGMFVDSYYNLDWNMPTDPEANSADVGHRAYVRTHGFALSFLGFEGSYTEDHYGATVSLRFGPSAYPLIGFSDDQLGIDFVKQAYVSLMPTEGLTIDFGQFDTIYGAEVADSWSNINYTRGALYFQMQPFWHQGLRIGVAPSDMIGLTFLVVNGVNTPFKGRDPFLDEGSDDKSNVELGAQLALTPVDMFSAYIGYYGAVLDPDGQTFSHFFDLVVNVDLKPLLIVFNADLGIADTFDSDDTNEFYGLSLAARLALAEKWGLGLRGEYLSEASRGGDPGIDADSLITATATLEYLPAENLVLRLDGRLEKATDGDIFVDSDDEATDSYFSTVLGVVVKTN